MPIDRQQGRQTARLRVPEARRAGRHLGERYLRLLKRGVATAVPKWNPDACIQCNRCSIAAPYAAIRPVLLSRGGRPACPPPFVTVPAKGPGQGRPRLLLPAIQVSPYDCLGCGVV